MNTTDPPLDVTIRPYEPRDEQAVITLWRRCNLVVPYNDPQQDIERKLKVGADLFLVGEQKGEVIATVMAGYEGHRGWINYLAVAPQSQGQGLGARMMAAAERALAGKDCPKINLMVRGSNKEVVEFYKAIGYEVEDRVAMSKRLSP